MGQTSRYWCTDWLRPKELRNNEPLLPRTKEPSVLEVNDVGCTLYVPYCKSNHLYRLNHSCLNHTGIQLKKSNSFYPQLDYRCLGTKRRNKLEQKKGWRGGLLFRNYRLLNVVDSPSLSLYFKCFPLLRCLSISLPICFSFLKSWNTGLGSFEHMTGYRVLVCITVYLHDTFSIWLLEQIILQRSEHQLEKYKQTVLSCVFPWLMDMKCLKTAFKHLSIETFVQCLCVCM